ncbi:MAG: hypothetical protein LAP40_18760 [Acidobacteriia bacterium]|nr:hypothetical protein [Terriglobia bacterium]
MTQTAAVTASLGGTSISDAVVLNAAGGPAALSVGPGRTYATPCQALTVAPDGAVIQIDATGTYSGDVCTVTANNITVKGINGRPRIQAAGQSAAGKGTWVFEGNNLTVDTIELTGATNPGNNGAGIRMEGQNLIVLNSYLDNNQEGLSTAPKPGSQIVVQSAEFNHNGFGDGQTHNVDIASAARFTMQYSYSHNANGGDLVKAGASENYILFNRLTSEAGTTSAEIDLANGGRSFVLGNLIEKGPSDLSGTALGYLLGGATASNPSSELYVVNNTFVNDKSTSIVFLNIASADAVPALVTNNILYGAGTISTQSNSLLTANLTANPGFANQAGFDYHLSAGSAAIDAGVNPGLADGISLVPVYAYLDPACGQGRNPAGAAIDIGAYEFGGAGTALSCALAVSGVTLSPNTVTGGGVTTSNTVTLSVPAPSAGAVVTLVSSNPGVASVPASLTVAPGSVSASFGVTTAAVTSSTNVTISASYSGVSKGASLTVSAPVVTQSAPAALSAFQCNPTTLASGGSSTCTVSLSGAAPAGGLVIALSGNSRLLSTPASVTVPAGTTSATFTVRAGWIRKSQTATVTATATVSKSVKFQLKGARS